ncbi:hypothetical protein VTL71DRAFT_3625 [Oculimacula yallundae]|uniref:Uncharacterized protein n=1 Tax=Oculimacula yallundae TaxID=86028 RepID=A0ABR4C7P8_9HELO
MASHSSRRRATNPITDLHAMNRNSWVMEDNYDAASVHSDDTQATRDSTAPSMTEIQPMDSKQAAPAKPESTQCSAISPSVSETLPWDSEQTSAAEPIPTINFEDYLRYHDPTQHYNIEYLNGFANTTVRATKIRISELHKKFGGLAMEDSGLDLPQSESSPPKTTDEDAPAVRFPYDTLIVKHSPPFVTLLGPEEPLSTFRQEVEAKALALLGPGSRLETLASSYNITFPRVLWHDRYSHILIMSDIGNMPTLKDSLRSLQSLNEEQDKREIQMSFLQLGTSIGMFLAELHASSTTKGLPSHELAEFANDSAKDFTYSWKIEDLKWVLPAAGVRDHTKLFKAILNDWKEPAGPVVFVNGNLTAESFLMQKSGPIGLIGWQSAGPGRGLNGDIATLFASIRVLTCDTDLANAKYIAAAALMQGIATSYRHQLPVKWEVSWNGTEGHWPHLEERGTGAMAVLRSAFIVYGTALIVAAATEFDVCEYPVHPLDTMCSIRAAVDNEDSVPPVKEALVCSIQGCSIGSAMDDGDNMDDEDNMDGDENMDSVKELPICSIRGCSIRAAANVEDNIHSVKGSVCSEKEAVCSIRGTLLHEGLCHVRWAGENVNAFEDNWEFICKYGSPLLGFVAAE